MTQKIKFVHTNIVARDWRKLAQYYITVFGCLPMYPERDLSGQWIDDLTNLKDVKIRGIHLKLPGYKDNHPTLEIFEYEQNFENRETPLINNPGFSHIAFHVDNVEEIVKNVIDNGGFLYGELVKKVFNDLGTLTVAYTKDIEGNIVEVQKWSKDYLWN